MIAETSLMSVSLWNNHIATSKSSIESTTKITYTNLRMPVNENALNWESRLPNHPCGTTGGEQADIVLGKAFCQVQKTGLVVDREDS